MAIYVICDYYIHKTDFADLSSFKECWEFSLQISKYLLPLESGNLQPEQTKFPLFSLCFGKISKFHVFSLTGIFFGHFPCFPCAVGTLALVAQWTMGDNGDPGVKRSRNAKGQNIENEKV